MEFHLILNALYTEVRRTNELEYLSGGCGGENIPLLQPVSQQTSE